MPMLVLSIMFKSGFTPKCGVIFGVTPESTPDFRCYLRCNTRNL